MSLSRRGLQPWCHQPIFKGVWCASPKFIARTVLVKDGDVEQAYKLLTKHMAREGLIAKLRRQARGFEKPTLHRARLNYEACKAVYDEDMQRKIRFISRKNRVDPFPGLF